MTDPTHSLSASGVRLSSDFRDNLIIDRFDPGFVDMRASKIKHMRSENSEDAITWNAFRTLRQINPSAWFHVLALAGGLPSANVSHSQLAVHVWRSIAPPPSLLEGGDEGNSEIDVVLETSSWVWFIEAKHQSDISTGTTTRPERDQILRNIDVGTYYAGVRDFHFSLLVSDPEKKSRKGADRIAAYKDFGSVRKSLEKHRPDQLPNLKCVSLLTWTQLGEALAAARANTEREDERGYADRALAWLTFRGIIGRA